MLRSFQWIIAFVVCSVVGQASAANEDDCYKFKSPAAGIEACGSIIANKNTSPSQLALALFHRGRARIQTFSGQALATDQAITDLRSAIGLDPSFAMAHSQLGFAYFEKGEFDASIAEINQAISLDPNNYIIFLTRAQSWREKNELKKALDDYGKVIELNPKSSDGYIGRSRVWNELGLYDRALADADEAIRLSPANPFHYIFRGAISQAQGQLDRALEDLDKAVELAPAAPLAAAARGDIHRYRGDFELALADYRSSLQSMPDFIVALAGMGLTYEKMGQMPEARAKFTEALNSRSIFAFDKRSRSALETVRARLAALDSGSAQPSIPSAPAKATSLTSVPTPAIVSGALNAPLRAGAIPGGRRVALVIGNSAYRSVPVLNNPQKDADAVARSLRNIGFDKVTLVVDGTEQKLIDAVNVFAGEAAKSDWAMVYFAGHGIEVNGQNYLIPVDAKLVIDRDVEVETIALESIKTALAGAKKLGLVVLDACRVNPFAQQMRRTETAGPVASSATAGGVAGTRAIGRGLGRIEPGNSGPLLVVFAAKDGQTALDGDGANSPFAVALVQRIATPGVEISKIFRLVRDDVMEATAGRQEPYTYGSLPGEDFYFVATK